MADLPDIELMTVGRIQKALCLQQAVKIPGVHILIGINPVLHRAFQLGAPGRRVNLWVTGFEPPGLFAALAVSLAKFQKCARDFLRNRLSVGETVGTITASKAIYFLSRHVIPSLCCQARTNPQPT